ncbi:MAG: type II toxin-antitoxin system HipA family toxin [Mizugakiibacter sp.]|uniref:type II toxin-antitoxin system HipA family toxin n=1 Tax=Mizugakiibacter sp. TaxID=1972610 RepID=UPI0031C7BAD1|nr:type II toxin-antitoxin system HipA family toxin [Xanthomonadaceae bacterium]
MARRIAALDIWMNGHYVGRWERTRTGADSLVYAAEWVEAPEGRPLSLSLPFARSHGTDRAVPMRGAVVAAWFENLIPDNPRILRRLRDRYDAASTQAFDLLAAIGRDCAGAVQLVPADAAPGDAHRIVAEPLDEAGVARVLRDAVAGRAFEAADSDAFRLSIAGAQEKTALLWHKDRWCIPRESTPSTHIFKLPLGLVGNVRADLGYSVELEWLCMELARELGLPVARVEIGRFENQKVLIVERFDRRLARTGRWWQRLPQEDCCQALGLPSSRRYEADRGPGIRAIMDLLRGSEQADEDRRTFFRAQLLFWLLAATDGHAKNFSLHLLPGGAYRLTPLYDILSLWPILGSGARQIAPHKARMAMAVEGKNRHYVWRDIHRWHWVAMAERLGLPEAPALVDALIEQTPRALDRVGRRLPPRFPEPVFVAVERGMRGAAKRLGAEPDRR